MKTITTALFFCFAFCLAAGAASENWPRYRGPAGTGHHVGAALPTKWNADNVRWRV
jgi:hypothetical protein